LFCYKLGFNIRLELVYQKLNIDQDGKDFGAKISKILTLDTSSPDLKTLLIQQAQTLLPDGQKLE